MKSPVIRNPSAINVSRALIRVFPAMVPSRVSKVPAVTCRSPPIDPSRIALSAINRTVPSIVAVLEMVTVSARIVKLPSISPSTTQELMPFKKMKPLSQPSILISLSI